MQAMKKPAAPVERIARVFNGMFTIQSTTTGNHRTLKIATQPKDAPFAPGARVVSLMVGQDKFEGFAFVNDYGVHTWTSFVGTKAALYGSMLWSLAIEKDESPWYDKGFRLLEASRCIRCNRALTTPRSILRGIGPICEESALAKLGL